MTIVLIAAKTLTASNVSNRGETHVDYGIYLEVEELDGIFLLGMIYSMPLSVIISRHLGL